MKLYLVKIFLLSLLSLLVGIISLLIGSVEISIQDLWNIFVSQNADNVVTKIILEIRLPRILLAIAVGGGLSVAGAVFQALLMNPLAEPYILGISSGGAFGAVLSLIIGLSFVGTQLFAFIGAISVVVIVFIIGRRFGEIEPNVLLLTGVMIGAFFAAAILLMMTMLGESLRTAVYWMIGNLSLAGRETVIYVLLLSILISFILSLNSQKYNVLALGSDNAKHFGVNSSLIKNSTYILASLLVGSIVSVSGIIGFVGLLVPHVCRMLFGIDNRIVVPASFFVGAAFLTSADTVARTIIAPSELPVGAVTAIIGAPIFIYLLRKRFNFTA